MNTKKGKPDSQPPVKDSDSNTEGALSRWSRRKHADRRTGDDADTAPRPQDSTAAAHDPDVETTDAAPAEPVLTDEDMPPLDSLDENSDYSMFLSPGVSERLRNLALQRLMHLPSGNIRDGLDDYDDNFRIFTPLGDTVTSDMKYAQQRAEEKEKEKAARELADQQEADQQEPDQQEPDQQEPDQQEPDQQEPEDDSQVLEKVEPTEPLADSPTAPESNAPTDFAQYAIDDDDGYAVWTAGSLAWPALTLAGQQRERALAAFDAAIAPLYPAYVDYRSAGRTLVLGRGAMVAALCERLAADGIDAYGLVTQDFSSAAAAGNLFNAHAAEVGGYLGAFEVTAVRDGNAVDLGRAIGAESPTFDIIIDTSREPSVAAEIAPPGYLSYAAETADERALQTLCNGVADLIGEFQKPRYFAYDADICAHGNSGIHGCTRCIDACPTLAIASIGDTVEVNPHLCQGGGTCASVCPTGALRYLVPQGADLGKQLAAALNAWFDVDETPPIVMIFDAKAGTDIVHDAAPQLPEQLLPVAVEEMGSVGIGLAAWLLARGVSAVQLLVDAAAAPRIRESLTEQVTVLGTILTAVGLPEGVVSITTISSSAELIDASESWRPARPVAQRAGFAYPERQREALKMAVDFLLRNSSAGADTIDLPDHAPFGNLAVNEDTCTLCMACVGVCPTSALHAGGDTPALRFVEWNCVQCSTCVNACPENSLSLEPRFVFDNDARMSQRTLNEDAPFACIACGKPFATASVMRRMQEKLAGHWMFQDEEKRNRLKMCEDCRVKDMFSKEGGFQPSNPKSQ